MLFEVKGENNTAIIEALNVFNKEAELEYRTAIQKANQITSMMGQGDVPLPKEFLMLYWEQDGYVYVRFPFSTPKVIKIFRKHKAMANNMEAFLKERGLKCKVQYKNEQEELEICSKIS
jgi:hypothetical protein